LRVRALPHPADPQNWHLANSRSVRLLCRRLGMQRCDNTSSASQQSSRCARVRGGVQVSFLQRRHPTATGVLQTTLRPFTPGFSPCRAAPLKWNVTVAEGANDWANECRWAHSTGSGLGENILMSWVSGWPGGGAPQLPVRPMHSMSRPTLFRGRKRAVLWRWSTGTTTRRICTTTPILGGSPRPGTSPKVAPAARHGVWKCKHGSA
jgi:hypothetical protein